MGHRSLVARWTPERVRGDGCKEDADTNLITGAIGDSPPPLEGRRFLRSVNVDPAWRGFPSRGGRGRYVALTRPVRCSLPQPTIGPRSAWAIAFSTT